ncbi:MAG: DNA mismatch repair protein MutS [Hyphomicrobiaceae bacterium]
MAQYLEIKAANPDSLLFYRMGDFYELFFEDAVAASRALGIVLTKRGKHLGEDIPMCGVPVHRADEYLQRLIRGGFRVAVCEQLEDPAEARKRGAKAVVRRDVVRLVTPGTLTEDSLLEATAANYLTALFRAPREGAGEGGEVALASIDISTGDLQVGCVVVADLSGELTRIAPSEVVAAIGREEAPDIWLCLEHLGLTVTPVPSAYFDSRAGERDLKARLGVSELGGFGDFSRVELAAVGALLKYIDLTQLGRKPLLRAPRKVGHTAILVIDAASRNSLELVRTTSGERQGSLLAAIDRTVTGPGARELAARLSSPVTEPGEIGRRLDAVGFLIEQVLLRAGLREELAGAPDVARALSRLAFQRGGPRDLAGIRDGIRAAARASLLLAGAGGVLGLPEVLARIAGELAPDIDGLGARLEAAIVDDPPFQRRDGGFVKPGFRADLDEARRLRDESREVMAGLQTRYQDETGVRTLKVRHNNVLGYFVEVTAQQARQLMTAPLDATFRHRQTMANAVRFTTVELVEIEGRISSAGERALAIEQEVFNDLAAQAETAAASLNALAAALGELDHHAGLAELAEREGYVRPVVDASRCFDIRGGRHPVVEQALRRGGGSTFVANDCLLGGAGALPPPEGFADGGEASIWLVTGPNMAGKSTFLRQNAIITVMAQMGAFVPALAATIGCVDRLFSRVGAADDLARGRSTFMVEMVETAAILNQAGERSLVILDEIGRGTATFDGLSIAWATVEHLHEVNRSRALFATHYHELTALAGRLARVANVTVEVAEWDDEIVFLHRVIPGAADRSYGIQVAKLAGLPAGVLQRASAVLAELEKTERRDIAADVMGDLPLFAAARPKSSPLQASASAPSPVAEELRKLHPDEMTPRAALEALYRLKALAEDGKT